MAPVLFVLFVVVPIAELALIIQVGQVIGAGWTILLLIIVSLLGAVLVKREGLKAWRRFTGTVTGGRLPTAEVVDGALVLLGGALMLTPGFLTDVVGLLLVVPASRALVNRGVRGRVRAFVGLSGRPPPRGGGRSRPSSEGVVDARVVRIERPGEDGEDGEAARDDTDDGRR